MEKIRKYLIDKYRVTVITSNEDSIVFESKRSTMTPFFDIIQRLKVESVAGLNAYYIGDNKSMNIFKLVMSNCMDEDKLMAEVQKDIQKLDG